MLAIPRITRFAWNAGDVIVAEVFFFRLLTLALANNFLAIRMAA
jgi:hypothetical protein